MRLRLRPSAAGRTRGGCSTGGDTTALVTSRRCLLRAGREDEHRNKYERDEHPNLMSECAMRDCVTHVCVIPSQLPNQRRFMAPVSPSPRGMLMQALESRSAQALVLVYWSSQEREYPSVPERVCQSALVLVG